MPKKSKAENLKENDVVLEESEIENEEELFEALLNWENDEELSEIEKESTKFEIPFRVDRIENYIETKNNSTYPYGRFEEDKYRKKVQNLPHVPRRRRGAPLKSMWDKQRDRAGVFIFGGFPYSNFSV